MSTESREVDFSPRLSHFIAVCLVSQSRQRSGRCADNGSDDDLMKGGIRSEEMHGAKFRQIYGYTADRF